MAGLKFKGSWDQVKKRLMRRFGRLNDDDLQYSEGKEEQLFSRLQRRLGVSKDEIKRIIKRA